MKRTNFDGLRILLSAHYTPTPGPMDKLAAYLKKHKCNLSFVSFPLYPKSGLPIIVKNRHKKETIELPWFLQYILEGYKAASAYGAIDIERHLVDLAICGDPLSFIHLYLFRKKYRIKKIVYFNVDFSLHRYQNLFMNTIYQQMNKFAYERSDFFMCLTPYFSKHVDPHGRFSYKNYVLTHWINTEGIKTVKRKEDSIIFAGNITKGLNFDDLLKALEQLKKHKINFHLDIYAGGPETENVKIKVKKSKLNDKITFKGIEENTKLTTQILPQYKIGICPYIMKDNITHSDHMFQAVSLTTKMVEYIAAGLPIVTTPLTKAFDVIESNKLGYLVNTEEQWYTRIKELLTDKKKYKIYSSNAVTFAQKFDEESVLQPILNKIVK